MICGYAAGVGNEATLMTPFVNVKIASYWPALALMWGVAAQPAFAQQSWAAFQRDQCTRSGFRQYSAKLLNIRGSWERACAAMPADINGHHFNAPDRCRNAGIAGEWGEFDVPDSSCAPFWGTATGAPGFQTDQCTRQGIRQYSARLMNIIGDWNAACVGMPADINGRHFNAPNRCRNAGVGGEWGEFDVPDNSCLPFWGNATGAPGFQTDQCTRSGIRQYSGKLMNIIGDWNAACVAMPADINGRHFNAPNRCRNAGVGGEWGEFDVPDTSCLPFWANATGAPGFQDQCTRPGIRQYSARLMNIIGDWNAACVAMPANINNRHFNAPDRCRNAGVGGEWGEFDVPDTSCLPFWANATGAPGFQQDQCTRPGIRQYSARLMNIIGDWNAACVTMPADIIGRHFNAPDRCRNAGINGEWGEFDVPDAGCDVHLLPARLPNQNPDSTASIWGFADTHNHQFADLAFGGAMIAGSTFSAQGIQAADPWCDRIHGPGGVGDTMGNLLAAVSNIRAPNPIHPVGGYPQFDGWPRWNTLTHQLEYYQWLKRAHAGGLQLMVMMAVNSEFLCDKINHPLGCDDMQAVDRQLAQAKALEKFIADTDGGWYQIVRSPQEARQAIHAGKLAVVLGIEVANLFGCARIPNPCTNDEKGQNYVRGELTKYFDKGVRHLFAIHATDNEFGGTAIFENIYLINNMYFGRGGFEVEDCRAKGVEYALSIPDLNLPPYVVLRGLVNGTVPSYTGKGQCNARGLTDLGKVLVEEMMKRHMIIDVDHMSWKAADDAFAIAKRNDYPLISGHSGYIDTSTGQKRHEGQKNVSQLQRIFESGGMVGVITAQGKTAQSDPDGISAWRTAVPNDCSNSSKTFAQVYQYVVESMGGPASARVGLATDLMGGINQPGPRYGDDACYGGASTEKAAQNRRRTFPYPFKLPGAQLALYQSRACDGPDFNDSTKDCTRTFNFDRDGLAHAGMLPDFIQDLRNVGLSDTAIGPLMRSAEAYIAMWEKAERFHER